MKSQLANLLENAKTAGEKFKEATATASQNVLEKTAAATEKLKEATTAASENVLEKTAVATGKIKKATSSAGQVVLDKTVAAIEKWLEEFPRIESYGLQVTNFAFVMRLSPAVEIELTGSHFSFPPERLEEILAENKTTTLVGMLFQSIKTAYYLHSKLATVQEEPLIVKIRISLSPEISVYVGKPNIS